MVYISDFKVLLQWLAKNESSCSEPEEMNWGNEESETSREARRVELRKKGSEERENSLPGASCKTSWGVKIVLLITCHQGKTFTLRFILASLLCSAQNPFLLMVNIVCTSFSHPSSHRWTHGLICRNRRQRRRLSMIGSNANDGSNDDFNGAEAA